MPITRSRPCGLPSSTCDTRSTVNARVLLVLLVVGCGGKKQKVYEDAGAGSASAGRGSGSAVAAGSGAVQVAMAFDKKCVAGDLEACRNLGVMHTEGVGVTKDARRAADQRDGVVNKKALSGRLELSPEVIAYERTQAKVISLQEKRREYRTFENDKEIYFWILDCIKAGDATEIQRQWKKQFEVWQDGGMKRPFSSEITISDLIGEAESSVEGL